MNLYLLSQYDNRGYDTYDSCVVAAENEDQARLISPDKWTPFTKASSWAYKPENVIVEFIGVATDKMPTGVVLASFNIVLKNF